MLHIPFTFGGFEANVAEFMALNRQFYFITLAFFGLGLFSCETDINIINEDANHKTVIYGLLDASESRHFIRINKSFAGEASAEELAAQPGINEYSDDELSAEIIVLTEDNGVFTETGQVFQLQDTIIQNKQPGAFSSPESKVYYFDATLNPNNWYRISCRVEKEDGSIETVTAESPVINAEAVRLVSPRRTDGNCGDGRNDRSNQEASLVNNFDYKPSYEIIWTAVQNGALYSSRFWFYYKDVYLDGRVERDSVLIPLGAIEVDPSNEGQIIFNFNTEEFYSLIGGQVDDYDADQLCYREAIDTVQFELEIAGEELATYREVNAPQTGVIQERPTYTNVTNGEGIFSTRYAISTRTKEFERECNGILLDAGSMRELIESEIVNTGNYTSSKGFCADFGGSPAFLCPDNCP